MDELPPRPLGWELGYACPACGDSVPAESDRCPHCDEVLEEVTGIIYRPAPNRATRAIAWVILGGGLILLVIAAAIWLYAKASA